MIKKLFYRDSLWFGAAIGIAIPLIAYFIIYRANDYALGYFNKIQILTPTTMQLIALCANLILFRFYMLKWDKEQSGKGMLLSTFLLAFVYIFLHRQQIL
jgi:hypothetical protein